MDSACYGKTHHLFYCDIPFIPFSVLVNCFSKVVLKIFRLFLCTLPCQQSCFHCHCCDKYSLQCQCIKQLLLIGLRSLKVRVPSCLPWTNCCSNVICYNFDSKYVLVTRMWNSLALEEELSVYVDDYEKLTVGKMKSVFVFRIMPQFVSILLECLHKKMNLPDLRGFHLPPYDVVYWKSFASIEFNTQPCMLRFVTYKGTKCQERYVKRLLFNKVKLQ
ncbi:E4.3 [Bovine adenovirus 7]|nr:E4.3 [Bovine adenovirus 7]